jgi:hypothetical protein
MTCDLCGHEDNLVQRCAFSELGVSMFLHPWCGDELAESSKERQDEIIRKLQQRAPP